MHLKTNDDKWKQKISNYIEINDNREERYT